MKINEWLDNDEYLDGIEYKNIYYFRKLVKEISNFIKNIPIPTICTWDPVDKRIFFTIGKDNKRFFYVDDNISYADFITDIEKWIRKFYPQYEIVYETEFPLDEDEIFDAVRNKGVSFDDAINLTKVVNVKEVGIIERIYMTKDQFVLNVDGKKQMRLSGIPGEKIVPISEFLTSIRLLHDNKEIRDFIFNNSISMFEFSDMDDEVEISYSGFMMLNFFKINLPLLKEFSFIKIQDRKWKWKNYIIKFESNILESDCLEIVKNNNIVIEEDVTI